MVLIIDCEVKDVDFLRLLKTAQQNMFTILRKKTVSVMNGIFMFGTEATLIESFVDSDAMMVFRIMQLAH